MLSLTLLGVHCLTGCGWRPFSYLLWEGWVSDEPLCMLLLPTLHALVTYIGSYQQCRSLMPSTLRLAGQQPMHLSAVITSLHPSLWAFNTAYLVPLMRPLSMFCWPLRPTFGLISHPTYQWLAKRHSILGSQSLLTGPGISFQPYALVGGSDVLLRRRAAWEEAKFEFLCMHTGIRALQCFSC